MQLLLQRRLRIGFNAIAVLGAPQPVMSHNGALLCESLDVLRLLLEYGARPDQLDGNGRLPATYAVTDDVRSFWAARGA